MKSEFKCKHIDKVPPPARSPEGLAGLTSSACRAESGSRSLSPSWEEGNPKAHVLFGCW